MCQVTLIFVERFMSYNPKPVLMTKTKKKNRKNKEKTQGKTTCCNQNVYLSLQFRERLNDVVTGNISFLLTSSTSPSRSPKLVTSTWARHPGDTLTRLSCCNHTFYKYNMICPVRLVTAPTWPADTARYTSIHTTNVTKIHAHSLLYNHFKHAKIMSDIYINIYQRPSV